MGRRIPQARVSQNVREEVVLAQAVNDVVALSCPRAGPTHPMRRRMLWWSRC
jgi:hypothetical protein